MTARRYVMSMILIVLTLTGCSGQALDQYEWASFPEYMTVNEKIQGNEYSVNIDTDNDGTRVILFIDEQGVEQYKSVFIKSEERVIIVDLQIDEEVHNERL